MTAALDLALARARTRSFSCTVPNVKNQVPSKEVTSSNMLENLHGSHGQNKGVNVLYVPYPLDSRKPEPILIDQARVGPRAGHTPI